MNGGGVGGSIPGLNGWLRITKKQIDSYSGIRVLHTACTIDIFFDV